VASNSAGNSIASTASASVIPLSVPNAPTNPLATAGNAKASISFTPPASNGESAITAYIVTSSPGSYTATGVSSPIVVNGLTNGTAYTFTIVATNTTGNSPASVASAAVTPIPIPDPPTNPVATAGIAQASVAFTPPAFDGGSAITGYTVTSSPGSFTATGASSPLVVTGLTDGTAYTFTVVATNAAGNSVASTASAAVASCGAFVSAGVYKVFACYNLGATDITGDPNTIVQAIHGNYYQWGSSTIVANASTSSEAISGWNTTAAANNAWTDGSKTANDPCPTGFRVPTATDWVGVMDNNTVSRSGSFSGSPTNFSAAISWGPNANTKTLTLPAAGIRNRFTGVLSTRGTNGNYWSSTRNSTDSGLILEFSGTSVSYTSANRNFGFSIRCVSE
jgi:uncharacterized protein (TIGR02145 family)